MVNDVQDTDITPLLRRMFDVETAADNGRMLLPEEIQFSAILTDEGRDLYDQIARMLPLSCPACGFKDPSHTFDSYCLVGCLACRSCRYVLQDEDFWHDEIAA